MKLIESDRIRSASAGGVEAHRVLRLHIVQEELRFTLEVARQVQIGFGRFALCAFDVVDQFHQRVHCRIPLVRETRLDCLDTVFQLLLVKVMTSLACAVDVEHRTAHMMIADLHAALALIGHVAIGARHARSSVHALVVHLELGMLRLQGVRARFLVDPILEADLVVVGERVVHMQSFGPREREPLLVTLEVILHMALAANVRPHLLRACILVRIEVLYAQRCFIRSDAFNKCRPRHPEGHALRIVAVDAGHRMLHKLASLPGKTCD